jgi:glycosyltransferase involved in cell wall biosynthesis
MEVVEDMKILVIVPAFNEAENIVKTIQSIKHAGQVDILVINDRSIDQTLTLLKTQKNIKIANLPCNLGIGGAVQTGLIYAKEQNYDIAIQIDGDGQHDPNFIWDMIHLINNSNFDIIIGSRFIDKVGFQSTKLRRIGIVYIQYLIRTIIGIQITDPTSGFRAFSKKAIQYFASHYPYDYPEPESIVVAHRLGMKIKELPVIMKEREGGVSSIYTYKNFYYMLKVTLAIMIAKLGRITREV